MRQVHVDGNLDGQTLQGPGRQSYFGQGSARNAVFVGQWEGTDFVGMDLTGADFSQARLYAASWRACTMTDALFPPGIGWLHHEVVPEIVRQRVVAAVPAEHRALVGGRLAKVITKYASDSWVPVASDLFPALGEELTMRIFRRIFDGFPKLLSRLELVREQVVEQGIQSIPSPRLTWGLRDLGLKPVLSEADGGDATILDVTNPPELLRLADRYELARWVERRLREETGDDYLAFVYQIVPLHVVAFLASAVSDPDGFWLDGEEGY